MSQSDSENEEKNEFKNKRLWLLIKGCTDSPQSVKAIKRKGDNGSYLHGMKYDFAKMIKMIENKPNYALFNTLENMRSLQCKDVTKAIREFAAFAYQNKCSGIWIYYTGHGEKNTGNWCLSDGVITLRKVLNNIKLKWGRTGINLCLDCCYSGNWILDLNQYQNEYPKWNIMIEAASFPGNAAYDSLNGGIFTSYISKGNEEEIKGSMYWSHGSLTRQKISIKYFQAEKNNLTFKRLK